VRLSNRLYWLADVGVEAEMRSARTPDHGQPAS